MPDQNILLWNLSSSEKVEQLKTLFESQAWQEAKTLAMTLIQELSTDSVSDTDPTYISLHNTLGVIYRKIGLNNLAVKYFSQANALSLNSREDLLLGISNFNLGILYFDESRWAEAMQHLTEAIKAFSAASNPDYIAIAEEALKDTEVAQSHSFNLMSAYVRQEKDSSDVEAQIQRFKEVAEIYSNSEEFSEAVLHLQKALDLCSIHQMFKQKAIVLNDLGVLYQYREMYEQSISYFKQALEVAQLAEDISTEVSTLNNYGLVIKKQGKLEEAIELIKRALELRRGTGDLAKTGTQLYNLASCSKALGEFGEALSYAQQALEIDQRYNPDNVQSDLTLLESIRSEESLQENPNVQN